MTTWLRHHAIELILIALFVAMLAVIIGATILYSAPMPHCTCGETVR